MPSGSVSGSGRDAAFNKGEAYGAEVLESTSEPEPIFNLGVESGSIAIRAHPNNSGIIYVGWDDQVDSTTGFPLNAGESISMELDVSNQEVYAIPDTGNDEVRVIALG